jgi:hypothetical protein
MVEPLRRLGRAAANVPAGAFTLIEHRLTPGGMAMATYAPAGPVKTGSFTMEEPTDGARRRRTKMEAGDR